MEKNDIHAFSQEMMKLFIGFHRNIDEKPDIAKKEINLYFETLQKKFTIRDVERTVQYLLAHYNGFYPKIADFFNALEVIKKDDAKIIAGIVSERAELEYKESLKPIDPEEQKKRMAPLNELLQAIEAQLQTVPHKEEK